MNVLGLSYGFHDSSVAFVRNGKVISAAAEERYSWHKHDSSFPHRALADCLRSAGIDRKEIDLVVYHESPAQTFSRVFTASLAGFPYSGKEFCGAMKAWLGSKLWTEQTIVKECGIPHDRLQVMNHHQSHASQAFLGSGWDDATVVTLDAVGEWQSTAIYQASWQNGKPHLKNCYEGEFPHSLGLVYSAFTAYLGFQPMDGECSTMALAAFGQPRYADRIRRMIGLTRDGDLHVDPQYFNFIEFYSSPYTSALERELGPARNPTIALNFSVFEDITPNSDEQRWADIAASVQKVLEEAVLALVDRAAKVSESKNLCLAGGVALNCVANSKVLQHQAFDNLYIPPDPGDGGAAVGAALWGYYQNAPKPPEINSAQRFVPYCGPVTDADPDDSSHPRDHLDFLDKIDPAHHRRYAKQGYRPPLGQKWNHQTIADESALLAMVADEIAAGKIVGWYQSRFEIGPRALGARSILIRPDDVGLAQRLSQLVKDRAAFRPYALAMSEESATDILESYDAGQSPYRWMQLAIPTQETVLPHVKAALHIDGTTRPQVCGPSDNPRFYELLQEVGKRLPIPAVINTSFNESGYPIVRTAVEALVIFARTAMDVVVINNTIIRKVP